MITAAELGRRLKAFNVVEETTDIIVENEDEILELNKQQLQLGLGVDGNDLPDYKPFRMPSGEQYGDYKIKLNPKNEYRYDMKLTGESYNNMIISLQGGSFSIESSGHIEFWDNESSGNILGLSNVAKQDLREEILQPQLVRRLSDKTGAKIG